METVEAWVLLIVLVWGGGTPSKTYEHAMQTQHECLRHLKQTRVVIPEHNAENEWARFATCKRRDG